jgi:hypothetical protein
MFLLYWNGADGASLNMGELDTQADALKAIGGAAALIEDQGGSAEDGTWSVEELEAGQ